MSRKSRRARARLVQEQAAISKLKARNKHLSEDARRNLNTIVAQQQSISDLQCQVAFLSGLVEKQRRKDVIVAYKSDFDNLPGPCYAINIMIDATHLNLMFRTPVKQSHLEWDISETKSVGDYACRMAREISRKLERGIADIITGKVVREEIV